MKMINSRLREKPGVCLRGGMRERFILPPHTNTLTTPMNIWETWVYPRRKEELQPGKLTNSKSYLNLIEIIPMLGSRIYCTGSGSIFG